jgi:hypothetical protein
LTQQPGQEPERQPWWLRALEPLRSEAAMFRVLLWVVVIAIAVIAVVLVLRAVT